MSKFFLRPFTPGDVLEVDRHAASLAGGAAVVEPATPRLIEILEIDRFSGSGTPVFAFQVGAQREGKYLPVVFSEHLLAADPQNSFSRGVDVDKSPVLVTGKDRPRCSRALF